MRYSAYSLVFLFMACFGLQARTDNPLALQEVLFLKKMGRSEKQIMETITDRGVSFRLDKETKGTLTVAGFGDSFRKEIAKIILLSDVISWKDMGLSEEEIIIRIRGAGITFPLQNDELLRLLRAGVPESAINAIQGRLSKSPLKGFLNFRQPAGLYNIQIPQTWNHIRDVRDDGITHSFTPQENVSKTEDISFGVSLMAFGAGKNSPHSYLTLEEVNERFFRSVIRQYAEEDRKKPIHERTGFKRTGKSEAKLGCVRAVRNDFLSRIHGVLVREQIYYVYHDHVIYIVGIAAPDGEFDRKAPLFRKILATFDIPSTRPHRVRGEIAKPQGVVEEFKESVVRVWAKFDTPESTIIGTGTGFFVRKDGYILTNHHVITYEGRISKNVWIEWDSTLNRKTLPAVVVGAVNSEYPKVDVALLKVEGTNHKPFRLTRTTPQGRHVKEQDRVIALGFPGITDENDSVKRLTLTTTQGTISRFVQKLDGSVNYIFMTAAIHKGNSGGPCFDRDTHSVIGLNSFGTFDPVARRQGVLTFQTGYSGVVPIDAALEHFPEILSYPENVNDRFTADDFVALGIQYLNQGAVDPAIRQFRIALARKPYHRRGHAFLGRALLANEEWEEAMEECQKALEMDPGNIVALTTLGLLEFRNDRRAGLHRLDEVLRIEPRNLDALLLRAEFRRAMNDFNGAIADARKASEIAGKLLSDPQRSMGETYYAMNRLEEGKRMFEAALKINSRDTQAALGIPRYHVLKGRLKMAAVEYAGLCKSFPDDPDVLVAAANHHFGIAQKLQTWQDQESGKEYNRAFDYYRRGMGNYQKRKQTPPALVYINCGYSASRGKRATGLAERFYGLATYQLIQLQVQGDGIVFQPRNRPLLQLLYYRLSELYLGVNKYPGTVKALLRMGRDLDPQSRFGKEMGEAEQRVRGTLSINDCIRLINMNNRNSIHPAVVAQIILLGDLEFQVNEKFIAEITDKVNPLIVLAFKGKMGSGSGPAPRNEEQAPPGFQVIRHGQGLFSLGIPKTWKTDQNSVQQMQQVAPWFIYTAGDAQTGVDVEIYHFANTASIRDAWKTLTQFCRANGIQFEVAKSDETSLGRYKGILVSGSTTINGELEYWVMALYSTPNGVFGISVGAPPKSYEASTKVLAAVLGSFKLR